MSIGSAAHVVYNGFSISWKPCRRAPYIPRSSVDLDRIARRETKREGNGRHRSGYSQNNIRIIDQERPGRPSLCRQHGLPRRSALARAPSSMAPAIPCRTCRSSPSNHPAARPRDHPQRTHAARRWSVCRPREPAEGVGEQRERRCAPARRRPPAPDRLAALVPSIVARPGHLDPSRPPAAQDRDCLHARAIHQLFVCLCPDVFLPAVEHRQQHLAAGPLAAC